jgi:hypothetical protein
MGRSCPGQYSFGNNDKSTTIIGQNSRYSTRIRITYLQSCNHYIKAVPADLTKSFTGNYISIFSYAVHYTQFAYKTKEFIHFARSFVRLYLSYLLLYSLDFSMFSFNWYNQCLRNPDIKICMTLIKCRKNIQIFEVMSIMFSDFCLIIIYSGCFCWIFCNSRLPHANYLVIKRSSCFTLKGSNKIYL